MAESHLFESILESENIPPCPLFDLDGGWYGLDGKFKKFYKPDMTYDMKDDAITKEENVMPDRMKTWSTKVYPSRV
jgi:hypothetical protein